VNVGAHIGKAALDAKAEEEEEEEEAEANTE